MKMYNILFPVNPEVNEMYIKQIVMRDIPKDTKPSNKAFGVRVTIMEDDITLCENEVNLSNLDYLFKSMNGMIWDSDAQIRILTATKIKREMPGILLTVMELDEDKETK